MMIAKVGSNDTIYIKAETYSQVDNTPCRNKVPRLDIGYLQILVKNVSLIQYNDPHIAKDK